MRHNVWWVFPLALVAAILAGCSGAGNLLTSGSSGTVTEYGAIVLSVAHNGSMMHRNATEGVQPLLVPVEADRLRVRVYNDDQNIVEDFPITDQVVAAEIKLPPGTYSVDAVAYRDVRSGVLSKGVALTAGTAAGIVVNPGQYTSVSLVLTPWEATILAPPEAIEGNGAYSVELHLQSHANIPYNAPLLYVDLTPWTDGSRNSGRTNPDDYTVWWSSLRAVYHKTAPAVTQQTALYYQIEVSLSSEFFPSNLSPLYVYFPSTVAGQQLGQILLTPPQGGIVLDVQ